MNRLFIGDLHFPYQHRDALAFLRYVVDYFELGHATCIGDETDHHTVSFWKKNPHLAGPVDEYYEARKGLDRLEQLFPRLDVCISNHGARPYRIAQDTGMPDLFVRSYNELYDKPKWNWQEQHVYKLSTGLTVVATHGHGRGGASISAPVRLNASYATVQGHRHTQGGVRHYTLPDGTRSWSAQTGCLIDETSPAFSYATEGSVLGSLVVCDDVPQFIPMRLRKSGRWLGRL